MRFSSALPTTARERAYRTARGFTLVEVLVVVAMMGILALLSAPILSSNTQRDLLRDAATRVADLLNEARSSATAGRNASPYGVHFETTQAVLFEGATYVPAHPDNLTYAFEGDAAIQTVTITGGGSDIHFADHRGIPTESGTIVLADGAGNTRTITVNAAGMITAE